MPPLHPATKQPVGPMIFCQFSHLDLIMREVSGRRFIEIPDQVQDIYKIWRPTPMMRAYGWREC